jgi:hypothetical protein
MSLVSILELNMMLVIDFHALVLQLLMDKKSNFKVLLYKMLVIPLELKQSALLIPLYQVLNNVVQLDLRFVVKELVVQMMHYGFHHLYQAKVV